MSLKSSNTNNKDYTENNLFDEVDKSIPVVSLLGEERVENLKDGIVSIILRRVQQDIDDWGRYIFYPPDYQCIIDEAFESVEKKLKKMYTDAMFEVAENSIKHFKDVCDNNIKSTIIKDDD